MPTECTQKDFAFHPLRGRLVTARFDGGTITSDSGGLLLREVERCTGIIRDFARCFVDHRAPHRLEHELEALVAQRVYGLALGYEDLNDHDELRRDPLMAVLTGKADPTGEDRRRLRDLPPGDKCGLVRRQPHQLSRRIKCQAATVVRSVDLATFASSTPSPETGRHLDDDPLDPSAVVGRIGPQQRRRRVERRTLPESSTSRSFKS